MDRTVPSTPAEVPARTEDSGHLPPRVLEVTVAMGADATGRDVLDVIRTVGCPFCRALPGKYCHDPKTGRADRVHSTRVSCYKRRRRRGAR